MRSTTCDICDAPATVTYEVYGHRVGFRPILGLHMDTLRMAGKFVDLCDEHRNFMDDVLQVRGVQNTGTRRSDDS